MPTFKQSGNVAGWEAACAKLGEELVKLNREILSYNLKLPPGVAHRPLMDMKRR